jgi:hypothetical protein
MSSERLRQAAQRIRDTANATLGDTALSWFAPDDELSSVSDAAKADAAYIALWSPPVALAVADWLDEAADDLDAIRYTRPLLPKAHTLADHILEAVTTPA